MFAPGARFVCIGNNARNGVKDLLGRLRTDSREGRLDPVVLFLDGTPSKSSPTVPLFPLPREPVRQAVGTAHYAPWTESAAALSSASATGEGSGLSPEPGSELLLFNGRRVACAEVSRIACCNGQLTRGTYARWTWDRNRETFVDAGKGDVLFDLPADHELVRATMARFGLPPPLDGNA